eukprot:353182-Chlamydomonas_euryale.AAC.8
MSVKTSGCTPRLVQSTVMSRVNRPDANTPTPCSHRTASISAVAAATCRLAGVSSTDNRRSTAVVYTLYCRRSHCRYTSSALEASGTELSP